MIFFSKFFFRYILAQIVEITYEKWACARQSQINMLAWNHVLEVALILPPSRWVRPRVEFRIGLIRTDTGSDPDAHFGCKFANFYS